MISWSPQKAVISTEQSLTRVYLHRGSPCFYENKLDAWLASVHFLQLKSKWRQNTKTKHSSCTQIWITAFGTEMSLFSVIKVESIWSKTNLVFLLLLIWFGIELWSVFLQSLCGAAVHLLLEEISGIKDTGIFGCRGHKNRVCETYFMCLTFTQSETK